MARPRQAAAGCAAPVRLASYGTPRVDTDTGEVLGTCSTEHLPDGVIYKACGNRRAAVCPSCAEIYRGDAYQLVLAGLKGGKGVPASVSGHPAVFATVTAPSFGIVHAHRTTKRGKAAPCRARRQPDYCRHGIDLRCSERHGEDDHRLGTPLCPDCYDYDHHAVWNIHAGELWRRTTITAHRLLKRWAREHGHTVRVYIGNSKKTGKPCYRSQVPARISFGKVAEFQRRGLVHYHILARLDGLDFADPDAVIEPPEWANGFLLASILRAAVEQTVFQTPGLVIDFPNHTVHEDEPVSQPYGWSIAWGHQTDIRPVHQLRGDDILTPDRVADELGADRRRRMLSGEAVAGYLAKYATKGTETTGYTSRRLTAEAVESAGDSHIGRIVKACWRLGQPTYDPANCRALFRGLRPWAHMLGYGGHFFTKSRRYTATFKQLRQARADWQTEHHRALDHLVDDGDPSRHFGQLEYLGTGWHTTADAILAQTSADLARIRRQTARVETAAEWIG